MKAKTQQEFAKKWVGIVEVKTGDKAAKLTSVESYTDKATGKVTKKLLPGNEESMRVDIKDLPKTAQRIIKPKMEKTIRVRIRLNEDGDAVENVGPVSGLFSAKLTGLGPKKKDQPAAPYTKWYNKGQPDENSHEEFFAVYEITDGVFRGVELPAYFLHYKFEGIPEGEDDEGFTQFNTADTPQASQLHRLQEWASVHGDILDEPIAWPDDGNILPELEERALDAEREVNVVIEKGYIKLVQPKEEYGDDEDDTDDAEDVESDDELDEDGKEVPDFMKDPEPVEEVKVSAKKSAKPVPAKTVKPVAKKVVKKSADDDDDL